MSNILDPRFKYVSAAQTNIRKTFAKVRRQISEAAAQRAKNEAEAKAKVSMIIRVKEGKQ